MIYVYKIYVETYHCTYNFVLYQLLICYNNVYNCETQVSSTLAYHPKNDEATLHLNLLYIMRKIFNSVVNLAIHACLEDFQNIVVQTSVLYYRLSQKLKLLGNGEFNHLTISLTLSLTCGPKLPLNKWGPNKWEFNILNGR